VLRSPSHLSRHMAPTSQRHRSAVRASQAVTIRVSSIRQHGASMFLLPLADGGTTAGNSEQEDLKYEQAWRQLRSQRNAARDANRLDRHATPVDRVVIAAVLRLAPHDLAAKPELPGRAVLHARIRPLRLRIAERTRLQ